MIIKTFEMKFVLGFLLKNDKVLLVKRIKKPYTNQWNGTGGKIAEGETPTHAFLREMEEETEIKLMSKQAHFTGIVTWDKEEKESYIQGMFVFTALLNNDQQSWDENRETREGLLAWHPIDWAMDKKNKEIAENIPFFLPEMLKEERPLRYHCVFKNAVLKSVKKLPLPTDLLNIDQMTKE